VKKKIILAVTGASGSLYVVEFLRLLADIEVEIDAIISEAGEKVMELELGLKPEELSGVKWFGIKDFTAPMASGSSRYDAMVVLPCSMGSLAAIANGMSANLIHRAADVMLKEKRPLILVARETPLNRTHIRNMLKAHDSGAVICPAMPSFYHQPDSVREMARQFAGRIADQAGLDVPGLKRWGE
jgi:4-hydroxy-3-polyprenylbenzoate decarboxylase